MLSFLPPPLLGAISLLLFVANLVFWIIPFYVVALAKLLVPVRAWRRLCANWLVAMAEHWISGNKLIAALHDIEWDVSGLEGLRRDQWYLISSNHQSWADIFVLQYIFNRRIPFLKFFLKKELIWLPLFGLAWWALDLPFMHRHSKEALAQNPELRGQDLETTRKACEHFRNTPTSVINFVEGTRFTAEKHARQESPYRYLLRPKTGGIAFVMAAIGETLNSFLDVTIAYPKPGLNFWDLLSGRIRRITVRIEQQPIPAELIGGDYLNDSEFRERFQAWVRNGWERKDLLMAELMERRGRTAA